jgi:serine/threonine protein kinase
MSPDPTPTGSVALPRLGRYQVLSKLGQGGMGAVYLARDDKLDRQVAIKVLPPESVHDPEAVARFQREARALAKLAHPGIVQAFDSDSADGRHFLVMEYVEGQSLADLLRERGTLSPGRAADYIHQAALALQHAHEKGLIHRDLKPSNLLLAQPGGQVKLLDLGLARFLQDQIADPNRTREGVGMGTPDYSAPEQFRDAHSADARSDLYSLGCTLYHLLSGRVPFPGSSLSEKYRAHCEEEPTPLEKLCPEVPAGLVLVVQCLMAKHPTERFQTAQELADALAPFVAGSSSSFGRLNATATWEHGQLTLTHGGPPRRRTIWVVATVLSAALLVGVGFGLAHYLQPEHKLAQGGDTAKNEDNPPKEPDEPDDPNVLTVAKTGKAKFRTINEALAQIEPGQTIRVLDSEKYEEAINLQGPRFAGITLEAPRHALLALTPQALKDAPKDFPVGTPIGVVLLSTPGVKVRGFRVQGSKCELIAVDEGCAGTILEDLEVELLDNSETSLGIVVFGTLIPDEGRPILVQDCQVKGGWRGVIVRSTRTAASRVVIRNNVCSNSVVGIDLGGNVSHVQVVGNRIVRTSSNAMSLSMVDEQAQDILFANNTTFDCSYGLTVFDTRPKGRNVEVRNNLFLGAMTFDMVHLRWNGLTGPSFNWTLGEGKSVQQAYRVTGNWREFREPRADTTEGRAWVPPTEDVRRDNIEGVIRDPKSPDFLRPLANSSLATQGDRSADPELPPYVGARPPKDDKEWDWDRTWQKRANRAP